MGQCLFSRNSLPLVFRLPWGQYTVSRIRQIAGHLNVFSPARSANRRVVGTKETDSGQINQ